MNQETLEVLMAGINRHVLTALALFVAYSMISCASTPAPVTGDIPRVDKDELKALLDSHDVVILDVRTSSEWNRSAYKIRGARRLDQGNADRVETMYPKERTIVVYCS